MSEVGDARLGDALACESITGRFMAHVMIVPRSSCVWWTGAISGRGHGRFWIADGYAIIAHRFSYALAYGETALTAASVLAHQCDNPLCQNPEHLMPTTTADNRRQWAARRHHIGGPLRDVRGSRGRSLAIREAIKAGRPIDEALAAGLSALDENQLTLW